MRVVNWPQVLAAKVEEWRFQPFQLGGADCLHFAHDVVLALTGADFRPQFPGHDSQEGAEQIMQLGGGVAGIVTACLGEPKHVSQAMRGDVLLVDFGHGPAAAICLGVNCCAPDTNGLAFRPTASATLAWTV